MTQEQLIEIESLMVHNAMLSTPGMSTSTILATVEMPKLLTHIRSLEAQLDEARETIMDQIKIIQALHTENKTLLSRWQVDRECI